MSLLIKMGYPVLTVTESKAGIRVRQDRFLESGPADPKENKTIWFKGISNKHIRIVLIDFHRTVPLSLLSVDGNGKASVDNSAVLDSREKTLAIDPGKLFKLNAGTSGVCQYQLKNFEVCYAYSWALPLSSDRVLYTPDRLFSIATEAAKGDTIFSLKDRIGLVHDAFALSRATFAEVSSALTLVDILKDEKECELCDRVSCSLAD